MSFSEKTIQDVWEKGTVVAKYDSAKWRKDQCGAWISRSQYGNRDSQYGWEIDHIKWIDNKTVAVYNTNETNVRFVSMDEQINI